jgi:hypothetical protein
MIGLCVSLLKALCSELPAPSVVAREPEAARARDGVTVTTG